MRVGILGGTGPAGRGLALRLAAAGIDVVIGSREAQRARHVAEETAALWVDRIKPLSGAENAEAAGADLVVVGTPWDSAPATAAALAERLAGKVVVSMANALVRDGREMLPLIPARGSIAAAVQGALPHSLVSAAFHHLPAHECSDLDASLDADVLVCSDQPEATQATMALVDQIEGLRPLDAGSLAQAGAIEAFTAVFVTLNRRYRTRSSLKMTGI